MSVLQRVVIEGRQASAGEISPGLIKVTFDDGDVVFAVKTNGTTKVSGPPRAVLDEFAASLDSFGKVIADEMRKDAPSAAVEDELDERLDQYAEELLTALRANMDEGGTIDKFNPNHDPATGEFSSGDGSGGSGISDAKLTALALDWSVGRADWGDMQHAARAVVSGTAKSDYVCYDCKGDDGARFDRVKNVMDAINTGPDVGKTLYRGLTGNEFGSGDGSGGSGADYKIGDTFSESLTSWTGKKELADAFAQGAYASGKPAKNPTLVSLVQSSSMKGINLSEHVDVAKHPLEANADEWLTSGQYRVTSVEKLDHATHVTVERIGPAKGGADLKKFNPNHDELGRFSSGPGDGGSAAANEMFAPGPENFEVTSKGDLKGYTAEPAKSAAELFNRTYNPNYTVDELIALTGNTENIHKVEAALKAAGPDTQTQFRDAEGHYTPERQQLHDDLLDKTFSPQAVGKAIPALGEQPTLYVLGGRGGSGKSWFSKSPESPFDVSKTIYINTDDYKEAMPEYQGWNAAVVHEESADIAARAHEIASGGRLNVTFDATLKSSGTITRIIDQYEKAGYKVEGYFMHTAPQVSTVRALNRFSGLSGRYVTPSYVLGSTGNEKVFDSLIPHFSKYAVYDNNSGSGPKLVLHGEKT